MNDLYSLFVQRRTGKSMHKWHHYFEIYERHFNRFRHSNPTLLEIGVQGGGSLAMWREYFGPSARIYGVDTTPEARRNEDVATRIFIGDQSDAAFLREVRRHIGVADILIDDGGHMASQQLASFETFYPMLSENGVYLVEDTHTAIWGGRFNDRKDGQTIMTFAAARCVELMDWTGRPQYFQQLMTDAYIQLADRASEFCRTTKAICFYDSVIVFEKGRRIPPRHEKI